MSDCPLTKPNGERRHLWPRVMDTLPRYGVPELPVPWVCTTNPNGVPVALSRERAVTALKAKVCPWCGQSGAMRTFVLVGAEMIAMRMSHLPPMHMGCALWAAQMGPWGDDAIVTVEKHEAWMVMDGGAMSLFQLIRDIQPVVSWWRAGQPLTDAAQIMPDLEVYREAVVDLCEDVQQRQVMEALFMVTVRLVPDVECEGDEVAKN